MHRMESRSKKSCLRWQWTRWTCSLGFVFILAAIISRIVMPMYVESRIFANLPLNQGQEAYENWKRPPVTPIMNLYVFNFTNTEAFMNGVEKPNLVELGPFVYRQKMYKTDTKFSQDGEELTHSVYREYYFDETLSISNEDTYVIVPNIPLFGLIRKMAKQTYQAKSITRSILESYQSEGIDTKPFIKISIKELFWGYPSILMSMARSQEKSELCRGSEEEDFFSIFDEPSETEDKINCDIVKGNLVPFGLFSSPVDRNGSSLDFRTVKTGKSQPFQKGEMVAWHNKTKLNYWASDECNQLTGRDPSGLPLTLSKDETMNLFIGQICRPLTFKFDKPVKIDQEFDAMRFIPEENSFSNPTDVPENQCYCLKEPCLPSGLLDISGCQPDSPLYISWPHFLHSDPEIRKLINGLEPDANKHSFTIDMLPKYGIALSALARLQMNVLIDKFDGFGWFENVAQDKTYLPVLWLEEGVTGPSEFITGNVKYLYSLPGMVANLQTLGLLFVGVILLIPEIILWSKSCLGDFR